MKRYLMWAAGGAIAVGPTILVFMLCPAYVALTGTWPGVLGGLFIAKSEGLI